MIAVEIFGCAAQSVGWEGDQQIWECCCLPHIHNGNGPFIQRYSSEIAPAWLVLEAIRGKMKYGRNIYFRIPRSTGLDIHDADLFYRDGVLLASASTAPLAICRAALKTVMGGKE